jgi:tetratricopeptide (TPR) repeat protein
MKTRHVMIVLAAGLAFWTSTVLAQTAGKAAPPVPAAPAAAAPQAPGEADFEAGRTLFFQQNLPAAIEKLKAAVAADPAKTTYKLLLAKAYRAQNQPAQAGELLRDILKLNPEHVEAGVESAELLAADKKYDEVIKLLEPLLKFSHDYPLYHLLAEAYYQKEDMPKAREDYEQAVKLNPRSGDDFYQLANIYLAQNQFAKAAEAYEKARALGMDSAVLHFKLASVYFNLRNYLGRVTTAEVIGGQVGQIKNDLLLLDAAPGKKDTFYVSPPASAIFQVVRAQQMGIDLPQIRFLEANIWLNARRFARADALYKALEGKIEKADTGLFWFDWAQAALGLEDYDTYLARLNKAIDTEPKTYKPTLPDAYVTLAARYQQRGDNKRYIEYLLKAVQANPLSAGLHLTLGDALWQLNDRAQARQQYRLVLELEPDHAERVRLLNRIREQEAVPATPPAPEHA